jgi:hypothetical protein
MGGQTGKQAFPFVFRTSRAGRMAAMAGAIAAGLASAALAAAVLYQTATAGEDAKFGALPRAAGYAIGAGFALCAAAATFGLARALEVADELRVGEQGLFLRTIGVEGFYPYERVERVRFTARRIHVTVSETSREGSRLVRRERQALVYGAETDPDHWKLKRYLANRLPAARLSGADDALPPVPVHLAPEGADEPPLEADAGAAPGEVEPAASRPREDEAEVPVNEAGPRG